MRSGPASGLFGTAALGLYLFDVPASPLRLGCIGLILLVTGRIEAKLVRLRPG